MKKLVVALVLAGGVAAVSFAALNSPGSSNKKINTGKSAEKKENKKQCRHTCPYSI